MRDFCGCLSAEKCVYFRSDYVTYFEDMKIKKIILVIAIINFTFYGSGYSQDKKEEMKQYLTSVNPVLTNVQITSRNISQKLITLESAIKQMEEYLGKLCAIKPPVFMEKQHKMILMSFYKMKTGF